MKKSADQKSKTFVKVLWIAKRNKDFVFRLAYGFRFFVTSISGGLEGFPEVQKLFTDV